MVSEVTDSVLVTAGPDDRGICYVRFNRPDKANALNAEIARPFLEYLESVRQSRCKALIIHGEGKNFCAGFDFDRFETFSQGELVDRFVTIEKCLQLLRAGPFASVALVQGAAFGAGADIVASATFRFGSERARFRFPGFRFGVALGTRHLSALIGMQKARDILL